MLVAWEHRLSAWGPQAVLSHQKEPGFPTNLSVGVRSSGSHPNPALPTSLALFIITPTIGWPLPAPSLLVGSCPGCTSVR